jgi:syntaxin 7
MNKQTLAANQYELEHLDSLIDERDRECAQIKNDMKEVNKLFKDIGDLINNQGDAVDSISDNIQKAHVNVKYGNSELIKAEKEQEKTETFYKYIAAGVAGAVTFSGIIVGAVFLL